MKEYGCGTFAENVDDLMRVRLADHYHPTLATHPSAMGWEYDFSIGSYTPAQLVEKIAPDFERHGMVWYDEVIAYHSPIRGFALFFTNVVSI